MFTFAQLKTNWWMAFLCSTTSRYVWCCVSTHMYVYTYMCNTQTESYVSQSECFLLSQLIVACVREVQLVWYRGRIVLFNKWNFVLVTQVFEYNLIVIRFGINIGFYSNCYLKLKIIFVEENINTHTRIFFL